MNPSQARIEAEKIVEVFKQLIVSDCIHSCYCQERECLDINGNVYCHVDKNTATQCAIKAVEMTKAELAFAGGNYASSRVDDLQSILTELKSM